ncbi:MAG: B3/B4 domain-containing protein [Phocaeicola sp.]
MQIKLSEEFKKACPSFVGVALQAKVKNGAYHSALWEQIDSFVRWYQENYTVDSIKEIAAIQATRAAYKACGKDPSRYRPSGEALCRRILRNLPLYQVDTLVDLINLVSIRYGYSIGGFDADKIVGEQLTLGIGRTDEPYEGIGRGVLNIAGMPVYRDDLGGVGTPTSDNERTKLSLETTTLLTIVNGYNGKEGLEEAITFLQELLENFAEAIDIEVVYFN